MPPKVVYGKRRNGERTAFTKFLSPEKDVAHREVKSQNADSSTTDDWREQLLKAAGAEESAPPAQDDISVLEKELEGLEIEQRQSAKEKSATTKKRTKPQKEAKPGQDVDVIKENIVPLEDALEQSMQTLTINGAEECANQKMLQKPKKPRKVLSDRNMNASNRTDCTVPAVPRQKKEKKRAVPIPVPQLPTPEATPEPDDIYSIYASPLLALSDRKKIVAFQDWADELAPHFEVSKIAEASFSEVYRLSSTSSANGIKEESVLKVVALKTPPTVPLPCQLHGRAVRDFEAQIEKETAQRDEDDQFKSQVEDVLSEVKLLQNLTHIPGFTVFRDLTVVQGRPSTSFNDAWKDWNKSRPRGKKSEFPDPSKKTSYDEHQLWAVVEMQDAGTDCEKMMEAGGLASIWDVWDVFWGVAISVGKAEEACRFEHRDLHLGNICVRSSRSGGDVLQPCVKDPLRRKLRFTGLDTTVIDYTLSRADVVTAPIPSLSSSSSTSSSRRLSSLSHVSSSTGANDGDDEADVDVAYMDLDKDPAIFQGDASEEYQYEIYRYMRGAAVFGNPMQFEPPVYEEESASEQICAADIPPPPLNTHIRFSDDEHQDAISSPSSTSESPWRSFHPKTNLIWLHFLLHKLLKHLSSSSAAPHSSLPFDRLILPKDTATAAADNTKNQRDVLAKVHKKAERLHKVLKRVSELLCPVALSRQDSLESVKELVVLALEERWVRVGDVAG
jgi:serine/threonine-protein kinase haspin